MTEYEKQIEHLTKLCIHEGWKHYAWQRLNELNEQPGFHGIKADVLKRIESLKRQGKDGGCERT